MTVLRFISANGAMRHEKRFMGLFHNAPFVEVRRRATKDLGFFRGLQRDGQVSDFRGR
jgi:hypothetical protein